MRAADSPSLSCQPLVALPHLTKGELYATRGEGGKGDGSRFQGDREVNEVMSSVTLRATPLLRSSPSPALRATSPSKRGKEKLDWHALLGSL